MIVMKTTIDYLLSIQDIESVERILVSPQFWEMKSTKDKILYYKLKDE
tara:strand:+ start:3325 stop:3468 length:144 start_codon:yes stop_codon:yes gene_type:complete